MRRRTAARRCCSWSRSAWLGSALVPASEFDLARRLNKRMFGVLIEDIADRASCRRS